MAKLLALDLDGTIVNGTNLVPEDIKTLLKQFHERNWIIAFITGRMYSFALKSLKNIDLPYILALQNGADVLEMPDENLIKRNYFKVRSIDFSRIPDSVIPLIYTGYEGGDFCYYNPKNVPIGTQGYIETLKGLSRGRWKTFNQIEEVNDLNVPLVKFLGKREDLMKVEVFLRSHSAIVIKDSVDPESYILLVTSREATKGKILSWIEYTHDVSWVVAAGDDRNDIPLFMHSDHAIAMKHAPKELKELADEVAENGLVQALKKLL